MSKRPLQGFRNALYAKYPEYKSLKIKMKAKLLFYFFGSGYPVYIRRRVGTRNFLERLAYIE